jgi:hypothetical protein
LLRRILKRMVTKARLVISPRTVDEAVKLIARRRRLPGFGNAGEVENFFGRAKINKAARLAHAQAEFQKAVMLAAANHVAPPSSVKQLPRPDVLVIEDFITEETSIAIAKEQFQSMQNLEHIYQYIDRLEATILQRKAENRPPHEIVADAHMLFTGPPGTGKTTAARKFGKLFYNLELLPTDRVVETTGKTLLGQYVGETAKVVTAKMEVSDLFIYLFIFSSFVFKSIIILFDNRKQEVVFSLLMKPIP